VSGPGRPALGVIVDGAALGDDEARALWSRFSDHMEAHRGDLAGFAAAEGFASVHPETRNGRAVLIASRTAPQRPYGNAQNTSDTAAGGSRGPQAKRPESHSTPRSPAPHQKSQKKS
jgi:hypothetical protein